MAPVEAGTQEQWDPRAGSRFLAILGFIPLVLYVFGLAGLMLLLIALAPGLFQRWRLRLVRAWGRGGLLLCGVRLEVHGLEHFEARGARIVLFNHQSLLDLFVLSACWPPRGVVIYKQEFHRVPIIGSLMRNLDFIAVDRGHHARAVASMTAAGRRIRERHEVLLVAPEGTRSRAGGLLPFKRGPFHLATDTGLPVVPMILRGARILMPTGSLLARRGCVRVDILPPIPTHDWVTEEVAAHQEQLRELFLRYLPEAEDSPRVRTAPGTPRPRTVDRVSSASD